MKRFLKDILNRIGALAWVLGVVASMSACEILNNGDDDGMKLYESRASLHKSVINYNETQFSGGLQGEPTAQYKITISAEATWASLSSTADVKELTGKVGEFGTTFYVYVSRNETTSERSGEVIVKFSDGTVVNLPFVQWGHSDSSDYNRAWGEQPAYYDNVRYVHKTYYTTLSGQSTPVRNYSICYDLDKLVSHWVAYPIHSSYTGGGFNTRTDAWAFDDAVTTGEDDKKNPRYEYTYPIIPQDRQQNIIKGGYGNFGYDRGHMLPSASRYSNWMTNAQTFYATNMFPQASRLNQNTWASLETKVRSAVCRDTLFCVVGTLYEAGAHQITSRQRTITVPSHCYKLLLRTKSGNTGKRISEIANADEIIAIGFLWENTSEANNISIEAAAVPISEIERRSGFTFYRELDPAIAAQVKSQKNYSDWQRLF